MSIIQNHLSNATTIQKLKLQFLELKYDLLLLKFMGQEQMINYLKSNLSLTNLVKYNFIRRLSQGKSLLVGEGNLSFISSIAPKILFPQNVIASTYESDNELSDLAKRNSLLLRELGISILHNIDATELNKLFNSLFFDTIIFQFPNAGSREAIDGCNPNYVLISDFLIAATQKLTEHGIILITCVDSDYYNDIFKFEELANEFNLKIPIKYKFFPEDYPSYEHTMSHQDGSALIDYTAFATWEFQLCNN